MRIGCGWRWGGGVEVGLCGGGRGEFLLFREPGLHCGMAADGEGVATEEEDKAPGEEMGDDEE